ncbi:MAG: DUF1016 domain-containing protein [Chitinophagaceae bacterium]|nr:DUF1016 domain-containing protein [Chitinophagaceae bacterium]
MEPGHSDLAIELFKDPYKFDFFQLSEQAKERDLENALVDHISRFLVEMGKGFAYVGRQQHFEHEGKDYYIDLLLYHLKLHCYVVLELKVGEFRSEYTGKMNFYLSLIDDRCKTGEDKPSIGIILCRDKSDVTVEYALRDVRKPIGVAMCNGNIYKEMSDYDILAEFTIESENNIIGSIGLCAAFNGFKFGGANAFVSNHRLSFSFDNFRYWVGPDNPRKEIWVEKRYDETWSDTEIAALADRWADWIINDIREDVERTK